MRIPTPDGEKLKKTRRRLPMKSRLWFIANPAAYLAQALRIAMAAGVLALARCGGLRPGRKLWTPRAGMATGQQWWMCALTIQACIIPAMVIAGLCGIIKMKDLTYRKMILRLTDIWPPRSW